MMPDIKRGTCVENLLFSLNIVLPVFLVILLGFLLRRRDVLTQGFIDSAVTLVFYVAVLAGGYARSHLVDAKLRHFIKWNFSKRKYSVCNYFAICLKDYHDFSTINRYYIVVARREAERPPRSERLPRRRGIVRCCVYITGRRLCEHPAGCGAAPDNRQSFPFARRFT